jgi:hypothetical protein
MWVWSLIACLAAFAPSLANGFWQPGIPDAVEQSQREFLFDDEVVDQIDGPQMVRPQVEPGQLVRNFDALVIGTRRNAMEALMSRLDQALHFKVEDVARECRLSEPQKGKLVLAGRGDIKRLVDRIYRERKSFESANAAELNLAAGRNLMAVARSLQESVNTGPFGDGSIFVRVLGRDFTSEQFAAYMILEEVQRLGGRISTSLRGGVEFKEVIVAGGLTDEHLSRLAKLPNLLSLTVEMSRVSNEGLVLLTGLTSLEVLDLSRTQIGDAGLHHLRGLKKLKVVRLRNTAVGDGGLAHLAELTNLRELQIQGTLISDEGLAHLKGLSQLEVLNLGRTRITDAGLVALNLPGLFHLKELSLSQTKLTGAGLALVSQCDNLERLVLIGTQTTDSVLRSLRQLKNLRHLLIDQTQITDDGLEELAGLARLESLEVSNTPIGDVGLFSLRMLANLKYVNVANTRVTDDGVSEFQRALPDAVVHK